jgi:hypothetical protein
MIPKAARDLSAPGDRHLFLMGDDSCRLLLAANLSINHHIRVEGPAMPTPKPLYAIYDFHAVRFVSGRPEAWELWDGGEWHEMDSAVAHHRAGLLTEQQYHRIFGHDLPPLPDAAFRSVWSSPLV